MDQPSIAETADRKSGTEPLPILSASAAEGMGEEACVVTVRNLEEFQHWLRQATSAVQWIQVEGLLDQPAAWIDAARVGSEVALDVVMSDPLIEYPMLYRLVDVQNTRGIRVTIPLRRGFLKALRLAAALHLPVRLLPGQPDQEELQELSEAVDFYLHDPMVEVPIEFFHSTLGWSTGVSTADLWSALEHDPAYFPYLDEAGIPILADTFVEDLVDRLERDHAECVSCPWSNFCRGYFKLQDPGYSCKGIVKVLDQIKAAAGEIAAAIGDPEPPPENETPLNHL